MAGVLVLDSAYQPHRQATIKKTAQYIIKNKVFPLPGATIIAQYRSAQGMIHIPSIVVLKAYIQIPKNITRSFKKSLVLARDDYTCQYCGRHKSEFKKHERLTVEHIKPVSKFSSKELANTYDNTVAACSTCNSKKEDKLPYECGMYPLKTPKTPTGVILTIYNKLDSEQQAFVDMIKKGNKLPKGIKN